MSIFKDVKQKLEFELAIYNLFDLFFKIDNSKDLWDAVRVLEDEIISQAMDYEVEHFEDDEIE